jgi:hypothetical protein
MTPTPDPQSPKEIVTNTDEQDVAVNYSSAEDAGYDEPRTHTAAKSPLKLDVKIAADNIKKPDVGESDQNPQTTLVPE